MAKKALRRSVSAGPRDTIEPAKLFPIVGVGASAGGLEAFSAFLKNLPPTPGMAFVLIQHLDPHQHSNLTELLSKATRMPVQEVAATTRIKPNHVYVMSPGVCLKMSDGHIVVEKRGAGRNLPVDVFLQSLAKDNTSKAIGIVLSGTASDGTLGLKSVKAEGGITFAQEPSSARFDGMPRSAIAAGVVDFVLPPEEIAKRVVRLARHSYVALKPDGEGEAPDEMESALNKIFQLLRTATGNDFTYYKHSTIRRRIHRRMLLRSSEKLGDYIAYLQENPAETRALADDLLICVTSFFREAEALEALANKVFPNILGNRVRDNPVRIWVPGCATGEECYSIAICLAEVMERARTNVSVQIFATDISESALEKARAGVYASAALAGVSPARLKRFFTKLNGTYQIAKSIRETCIFAKQNLTKDPPFHNLDLISCCNVLIYFGPVLQKKALATFQYALKPGGFLMLGHSESASALPAAFSPLDKKLRLFSKKAGVLPVALPFLSDGPVVSGSGAPREPKTPLDLQKAAERILLEQYAPAGVIVDDAMNIVHIRGDIGPYLQIAPGEPTYNVLKLAREGIAVGLRTTILDAQRRKTTAIQQVRISQADQSRDVRLRVVPIAGAVQAPPHLLILFEDGTPVPPSNGKQVKAAKAGKSPELNREQENARLRQELAATREYLQSIIEEQEASTEELKSANEEAQATNEELETSKEELQSTNEELNTLNEELKIRNISLTEVNSDLANLLTSINIPLVIVGRDLNIRRFTRSMEPMLNLIDSDVGRSISDLKANIEVGDLRELLQTVLRGGVSGTREIQGPQGRWYSLEVLPYKGPQNSIDGAVLVLLDIDAIKHARDSAEAIVETVPQPMMVLTKELSVASANRAYYKHFQVSKEDTENHQIYDLGNGQWNIPGLREALGKILPLKGAFNDFEVVHEFERIGRRTMLLNARELQEVVPGGPGHILLAIDDITGRKRAEEARRESEARFRTLFELGPVAVYSCDASGIILDFNRRAVQLWGREPQPGDTDERFCGSHKMLTPEGVFMPHELCPMADVLAGKIPEARDMEVQIERPDGSRITVIVNIRSLKNELGEITGAINCFVDITALKRVEEELRESRSRLERANEDLKHFSYAASHDLQEPLRMVATYTQLLSREYKGRLGKQGDQYISYALDGAQRMDALLRGLRDYWQADQPGEDRRASIDSAAALKDALLNLQETIRESGAVVTHGRLPTVWAEEIPLVQLFQNLVANGIKYRSKKPPKIHVAAAKNEKNEWIFSVKDNGIGIDPDHAQKVFLMFHRLNGGNSGSGIGLAICRKVVERLGGRIWVESTLGDGASFKFTIPSGRASQ